jgi:rhodanese-related sulfurtransferase
MAEGLRISAADAKRLVDAGEAIILDVVAPGVWAELEVAVPAAVRIPPDQVAERLHELPRDRAIVAYCT